MKKIIGQESLVNEVSRIFTIFNNSKCVIRPHFILTGPSGSGKSHTIKTIAIEMEMQFLEINAAQLTKEGTSGNSLSKALSPLLQMAKIPTVVFVDEFDKLFISGNSNSDLAHESTNGVQNEFLKVLETETTSVFGDYGKYINVPADNILFVFAGAFNGETNITVEKLQTFGVKTEFLGRVNLIYETQPLTVKHMVQILKNSDLLDNYLRLFQKDKDDVLPILEAQIQKDFDNNTLGARYINSLIHKYFITGLTQSRKKEVEFKAIQEW